MPHHEAKEPSLLTRMRGAGIRLTAPRRAIAQVLESAEEHLDVDEITRLAKALEPGVNRATVYRTLGTLKKIGLVDELDLLHFRGDRHYYEVRNSQEHAHLICTKCGKVLEPTGKLMAEFRRHLARETGYSVSYVRIEVSGRCERCQA